MINQYVGGGNTPRFALKAVILLYRCTAFAGGEANWPIKNQAK